MEKYQILEEELMAYVSYQADEKTVEKVESWLDCDENNGLLWNVI